MLVSLYNHSRRPHSSFSVISTDLENNKMEAKLSSDVGKILMVVVTMIVLLFPTGELSFSA